VAPPTDPFYDDDYLEDVLANLKKAFPEFEFEIDRNLDPIPEAYTAKIGRGSGEVATEAEALRWFEISDFLHLNCKLSRTRH
jgi:hypothetical protein